MNWPLFLANTAFLAANTTQVFLYCDVRRKSPLRLALGVILVFLPYLAQSDVIKAVHGYRWFLYIIGSLLYPSLIFHWLAVRNSFTRVFMAVAAAISLMQINWLAGAAILLFGCGRPLDSATLVLMKFLYALLFLLELPFVVRVVRKPLRAILDDIETQKWYTVFPAPASIFVLTHVLLLGAMTAPSALSISAAAIGVAVALSFYWHIHVTVAERNRNRFLREQIAASNKLVDVYEHYNRELGRQENAIRMQRHDFRHVLIHLGAMLEDGDTAGMNEYIADALETNDRLGVRAFCENKMVNAVVAYYFSRAAEHGTGCAAGLSLPARLSVPEAEVAVMLGNALDNCVKAAAPLGDKGWIRIDAKAVKDRLVFKFANNHAPGGYAKGSGLGLASIRMICGEHGGRAETSGRDGEFRLTVNLPL